MGFAGDAVEAGFLCGLLGHGGDAGRVGAGALLRRFRGARRRVGRVLGGLELLGLNLILDLVEDLGPDDDVGKRAELRDPPAAHEPCEHEEVRRAMGLAGRVPLVRPGAVGELGEEVGEGGREGEGALPLEGVLGEAAEVAVGGEDVEVAGVQRGDGDGAAPEDEVLGVFADLAEGEDVALADLVESVGMGLVSCKVGDERTGLNLRLCWLREANKLDHGRRRWIRISLQLLNDFLLVICHEEGKSTIQKPRLFKGVLGHEGVGRRQPKTALSLVLLIWRKVINVERNRNLHPRCEGPSGSLEVQGSDFVLRDGFINVVYCGR